MDTSSTREGERKQGENPDPKLRDDAEARMKEAPIKHFEDLPDDHPMARRAAAMREIEAINETLEGEGEREDATATAIARAAGDENAAPPIEMFKDKPVAQAPAAKPKEEKKTDAQAQVAAQDLAILDDLDRYQVRVKIDGVETLVPASKALGQYQKGAAADVRLAKATQAQREAEAALAKANSAAAAQPTEKTSTVVHDAKVANERFREASELMLSGDANGAAEKFAEAVAMAQNPDASRRDNATDGDIVGRVTSNVVQELSKQGALNKLFEDYPEIREKRAFGLMADEYVEAFRSAGDSLAVAIYKAGEALGEEYGLGKFKAAPAAPAVDNGRPLEQHSTTRAARESRKESLDVVPSGNVRASDVVDRELTPHEQLQEMQRNRAAGYAEGVDQRRRAA